MKALAPAVPIGELESLKGRQLVARGDVRIAQAEVDAFGDLMGDSHWLHRDPVRAKAEGPHGGTIVYAAQLLALLPAFRRTMFAVIGAAGQVNYGFDRVRFPGVALVGQPIRCTGRIVSIRPSGSGRIASISMSVQSVQSVQSVEASVPACTAESLVLFR